MKKLLKILGLSVGGLIVLFIGLGMLFDKMAEKELNASPGGKIANSLGVSHEQAETILNILNSVGINEIAGIKYDDILDNSYFEGEKGYRINNRDVSNVIMFVDGESGTINSIRYLDHILYKDNTTVSKISDFIVTIDEQDALYTFCKENIKSILQSPTSAKFPNVTHWVFGKQDGVTTVQSYVDHHNAFGSMIRSEFQFKIQEGKVISFVFDGIEYIQ